MSKAGNPYQRKKRGAGTARCLTIVGGVRDGWVVTRRGHWKTVRARGADLAASAGRSASPLDIALISSAVPSSKPPPSPHTTDTPRYIAESVLECLYSVDTKHRAVLTQDRQGLVHVRCEMWDLSEWEHRGIAFRKPIGKGVTITDTIENARVLARERLVELGAAL